MPDPPPQGGKSGGVTPTFARPPPREGRAGGFPPFCLSNPGGATPFPPAFACVVVVVVVFIVVVVVGESGGRVTTAG